MVSRMWSLLRFVVKGGVAGGAVYMAYDQGLLGSGDRSLAALRRSEEVAAPALRKAGQYVCEQTGLRMPQLPALPKVDFHFRDSWDSGILAVMNTLSEAPSKAGQYSRQGWDYVKERLK
ncbi:MICOS complex subunit MIC13 [Suncus etruscus]|uniref:MICOS complex subunit MIC13 n=1 Tax=Suncus etruscus TaxID=109475 RepID=UPI00210F8684|nr:MICOS complex subunit MIC13 [Suncus etruscus]